MTTDGRTVCALEPEERVEVRFGEDQALLAQVSGRELLPPPA